MFYVSSIKNNLVGIMDTYDNVEEFYSPSQIKEVSNHISIKEVSSKGIKKINLGEALLTREIIEKIDCEKELSFEVVDNLAKYRLSLRDKVINDDFMIIETDISIKLISDKVIILDNSTFNIWAGLFKGTKFTRIDFHNTNTSNVKNMNNMFMNCHATYIDLSSFDTSNVESMSSMFKHCHATSLNLSSFDTSNVKDMDSMFEYCHATSLGLSNFDTSNVEHMDSMFENCHVTSLDLSNFDTSNVGRMNNMFRGCYATSINLSNFDTSNVEYMGGIFESYEGTIKSTDSRILKAYAWR